MPRYRRLKIEGATYFFTVNTHLRRPILTTEVVREALREGIMQLRQNMPFTIEAWVLLPDHIHTIWTLPPGDANYASRWAIIKREASKRWQSSKGPTMLSASQQIRQETGFWQRRFWEHQIRDDIDFQRHLDYIHWNPVKHGYARKVADWPYSTFHRFLAQGLYPPDWGGFDPDGKSETDFGE
jgi:putative transposase